MEQNSAMRFAASATYFTRDESESFIDLVSANLFDCSQPSTTPRV